MIVRLFCPKCAFKASKNMESQSNIEIPVPISRLSDSGKYMIECSLGHKSTVILNNLKFELLFEMGLNAFIDGYPREAVSSFSSSLERFYEFYWKVVMNHFKIPADQIKETWKPLSKFSERQIGAFSAASLLLTKKNPKLLNPNKEVSFRNNVIHNGYIPADKEAILFGDTIKELIEYHLDDLRQLSDGALRKTFEELSPKSKIEDQDSCDELVGITNILTAINVQNPPRNEQDTRHGSVENQFQRILNDRQPNNMLLLSKEEMQKRFPNKNYLSDESK